VKLIFFVVVLEAPDWELLQGGGIILKRRYRGCEGIRQ